MKSSITNQTSKTSRPYPKLMIDVDGDIFYMMRENYTKPGLGVGIVVHAVAANTRPGSYSDCWDLSLFEDFEGELTLSND